MNEVLFAASFQQGQTRCIATAALSSCTGVVIVSLLGAILAHIRPHPLGDWDEPHAGGFSEAEPSRCALPRNIRVIFSFKEETPCVVSAMCQRKVARQDQRALIIVEESATSGGLTFMDAAYIVMRGLRAPRDPGHGAGFIDARGGTLPA